MADAPGYHRQPSLHGDVVAFVCEDDLWSVPAAGGFARRLTASPASAANPVFSPDGRTLAFTGRDDGPAEAYVMPADGGEPRRITWFGAGAQVLGWRRDGKRVLVGTVWKQPFVQALHLHAVPADGGAPEALGLGPVSAIAFPPRGRGAVLARGLADPARWKRYRGGRAGTLWIDRAGRGRFERLIDLPGNVAAPMWIGARIFFLSDHEGHGNLYSCTPTGRSLKRHTHHEDFYVRAPSTDGRRVVYQAGGDLHLYDPKADEGARIDVRVASPRVGRARRFVEPRRFFESYALHPKGHSLVSVHRGGVHAMPLWEGASVALGAEPGVRERLACWLPDGERVLAVTDADGEESLVIRKADGTGRPRRVRRSGGRDFGRVVALAPSPAGPARVALANHRQELLLVELSRGGTRLVARSEFAPLQGLAWSPDGRWLAYALPEGHDGCSLFLHDVGRGRTVRVTDGAFKDVAPSFDPRGRYLYFLSWRTYNPVYDSHAFDLGFPRGCRPYLVTLRKDLPSPFDAAQREPRAPGAPPPKPAGRADRPPRVRVDAAGIGERIVAFPVPEDRYAAIEGADGDRALFVSFPPRGTRPDQQAPSGPRGHLRVWSFDEAKLETVMQGVSSFRVSADGKAVAIRSARKLRVVPPTFKAGKGGTEKDGVGRESGWVDLDRHRVAVVPGDEWRQMFREAWRLQRDHFWSEDMSGVDWKDVHDRYLPLVDRVATRAEFSDLMWEMQGELGTSHCYEMGGDYLPSPRWHQGFLGADLELRGGSWRVARVPRGDSWASAEASPLAAPGVNVGEGDRIVAVDGVRVGPRLSPEQALVHAAGRAVTLRVRPPGRGAERSVTVTALRDEQPLRYRDWVERNRERVHRATRGRVGYVHVPDMGPPGFAEFHRAFLVEVHRDGLIVDVRYNRGGHVSQLLLEKLMRRRVGWDASRWGRPETYPQHAPAGPMVALTNEYAGSDGDIFSHGFKLLGLGPLVGTRTWGGVVGIWPRHALVDGTVTTQPEFAFWFEDVEWGVENFGTEPDVEVEISPQDHRAGKDPQLERGLAEVRRLLRENPVRTPRFDRRPSRRPPRLGRG